MLVGVKRLVPLSIRRSIRLYLETRDESRDKVRLFGDLAPLVPPVAQMFDGHASLRDFKANGEEFLKIYRDICGLQPDEKMLDVGCGIGRKTLPVTQYFSERAVYEGVDIVKAGIDWCCDRITPRFPNFHFRQIDVYNKHYNPSGTIQPEHYKFPFADDSFTFVVLGSVFTHMLPADVTNYLSEIHRVQKKNGRCLISYFLLNEESLRLMTGATSAIDFKHVFDGYRAVSREVPEQAIAFDERWIRELYGKMGLRVLRIDYGSWSGRSDHLSYQDLILAVKE